MTRTDTHRPSAINPAEYQFVAHEFLKIEDIGEAMFLQEERRRIREHMATTGGTYSHHEHGGNCMVCGPSHPFRSEMLTGARKALATVDSHIAEITRAAILARLEVSR